MQVSTPHDTETVVNTYCGELPNHDRHLPGGLADGGARHTDTEDAMQVSTHRLSYTSDAADDLHCPDLDSPLLVGHADGRARHTDTQDARQHSTHTPAHKHTTS